MRALVQAVADFLVDETCHVCGRRIGELAHLSAPPTAAAAALTRPIAIVQRAGLRLQTHPLCRACLHEMRPWPSVVSLTAQVPLFPAFETDACLLALVHLLKFSRRPEVAPWLAHAMSVGLCAGAVEGDPRSALLVPVPMDAAARRRRGFNQAERIARALGACWGVEVRPHALVKTRATRAQSSLDRDRRLVNLTGAIAAAAPAPAGRRVIIVDDLVTTGATAMACATALAASGVAGVRVVCAGYRP